MAGPLIVKAKITENSEQVLLGRIVDNMGAPITQDGVYDMILRVFDNKTGTKIVPADGDPDNYDGTTVHVEAIFDTLQTDPVRWTTDDIGFNIEIRLDGSYFPEGDTVYQVELCVTPRNGFEGTGTGTDDLGGSEDPGVGSHYYCLWQLTTINIWSE